MTGLGSGPHQELSSDGTVKMVEHMACIIT